MPDANETTYLAVRDAAIISAYTGRMVGQFADLHKYAEELMGRPILTHEFGDAAFAAELKKRSRPDAIQVELRGAWKTEGWDD